MKKQVRIKQRDITDSGATCLASVAAHYELSIPVARIRQIASTDKNGTSVPGLVETAEKLGFSVKGVKGDITAIPEIPTPTIAHVIIKEVPHHYVVIFKVSNKEVGIMDPATGKSETQSLADFEKIWSGVLILLAPNEQFCKADHTVIN